MPVPTPPLFPCSGRYASRYVLTRREMLTKSAGGLGGIALSWLLAQSGLGAAARASTPKTPMNVLPRPAHFAPRAKRMIFLYMGGGPSPRLGEEARG